MLAIEAPFVWTYPHVGEWFTFWYAGHIVASGGSVYDPASWASAMRDYGPVAHGVAINLNDGHDPALKSVEGAWIWPPLGGLLLAPFGMLPLEVGIPALHAVTIVVAVVSALALVRAMCPPDLRPLALAALLASPPLVQPMRAATLTIVELPALAVLFTSLAAAGGARVGVSGFLMSIRPQVFLLAVPAVVAVYRKRGARQLALAALTWIALSAASFALAPFPLDPALVQGAQALASQDNSSTWRLASLIAGDRGTLLALAFIGLALTLAILAIRRAALDVRDEVVVACGLALAVAVVPYAHTYDHLVLFPAWLIAFRGPPDRSAGTSPRFGAALVGFAISYAWVAYLIGAAGTRAVIAVSPYLALALLALVADRDRRLQRVHAAV